LTAFTLCSDVLKHNAISFCKARIKRSTNASTSSENMVKIGSVTLEFKKGVVEFLQKLAKKTGQKFAYPTKYLSNYWTDLYCTFNIASHIRQDCKSIISFAVAEGTLLW